ncbi:uncharacterized protein LOC121389411 [Gigantopelta aegis]|uniref:uncharacterized protein LOC121389411 n=1 Tax=Gigantopelta aegis TaxID=1735272 RepID=UPI001B887E34|nr:uncharacterized protein LOC121389411 [Gigantopelta aegis]
MDRFHDPRSLLCGHSFCHQCLEDHVFSTVTLCCFRCPICRKPNYSDNTKSLAEQFSLNYSLIQISEQITQQQMAPVVTGSSNFIVAGGNIVDSKVNITSITNVYGIDAPKAKLKKSLDQLETSFQSMEVKLQYQRQQELVNLDLNVSQIKHDIDASAEKLIELYKTSDSDHKNVEKFIEEICGGRESQHIQLSKLHETTRTKIDEQFNEERMVLVEPRQLLQDNLLGKDSLTDLEIEKNTERIDNANKILTDYLAQNQTKPTQTRITFTKSACEGDTICPNIGILSWTDGQTEMKGDTVCPDIGILCLTDGQTEMKGDTVCPDIGILWLTDGQTDMEMKRDTEHLTPKPWSVTVLGINLFVVSGVNTVTCMTSSGDINWVTSPDTKLRFAWGIACDRSGFVYVVDRHSNTVIQLSPSGEYLCDVRTGRDKISVPRALCFNRDLLYITQDNGEIKIFIEKQN